MQPGHQTARNFGAAIDIGTTTVTVWLVDLQTGEVEAQAAEYNGQIARGEDVISRIIYAGKNGGWRETAGARGDDDQRAARRPACKRAERRPAEDVQGDDRRATAP